MSSAAVLQSREEDRIARTSALVGVPEALMSGAGRIDVHEALAAGLPSSSLRRLVHNLRVLDIDTSLEKGIGLSRRTYQRLADTPGKRLSVEASGRLWKFAEILSLATDVLGSQDAAEHWLETPSTGLNQRRPIDLLGTPAGAEAVETLLHRIDYGVYT